MSADEKGSNANDEIIAEELTAWNVDQTAKIERGLDEITATCQKMMDKAADPANRKEVLAWLRQRIDVPLPKPAPRGRVKVSDLKPWLASENERRLKEADASMRATFERFLTTRTDDDLH